MVEKRIKLTHLELFRGIAILAVLAIHTTSSAVAGLSTESSLYPLYLIVNAAAHFAVPAFLFLSSLVLFYHYDDGGKPSWLSFYRKRLNTIVIPYLLWSLFYSLIVFYARGTSIQDGLLQFLGGLPVGGSYAHLYFIVIIAQFYLLFPLFHLLLRIGFVRRHPLLCGAAAQTAFYLANYDFLHMNKVGTFIGSYLLYFFLGAYAAMKLKAKEEEGGHRAKWGLAAGFAVTGVIYVGQMWLQRTYPSWLPQPWLSRLNFVSDYTYAAFCCMSLLQTAAFLEREMHRLLHGALLSIGTYSFGIYFIHPFILLIWRQTVMNGGPIAYHLLTWAGGAAALTLSWLLTAMVQHTRLGTYLVGKSNVQRRIPVRSEATESA